MPSSSIVAVAASFVILVGGFRVTSDIKRQTESCNGKDLIIRGINELKEALQGMQGSPEGKQVQAALAKALEVSLPNVAGSGASAPLVAMATQSAQKVKELVNDLKDPKQAAARFEQAQDAIIAHLDANEALQEHICHVKAVIDEPAVHKALIDVHSKMSDLFQTIKSMADSDEAKKVQADISELIKELMQSSKEMTAKTFSTPAAKATFERTYMSALDKLGKALDSGALKLEAFSNNLKDPEKKQQFEDALKANLKRGAAQVKIFANHLSSPEEAAAWLKKAQADINAVPDSEVMQTAISSMGVTGIPKDVAQKMNAGFVKALAQADPKGKVNAVLESLRAMTELPAAHEVQVAWVRLQKSFLDVIVKVVDSKEGKAALEDFQKVVEFVANKLEEMSNSRTMEMMEVLNKHVEAAAQGLRELATNLKDPAKAAAMAGLDVGQGTTFSDGVPKMTGIA